MYQAQVDAWGEPPKYNQVADLPTPAADEVRIKVLAVGAHRVVQSRASGKHYSSGKPPHIPGVDGVGELEDGSRVYFSSFAVGAMRDYINMPRSAVTPLPDGLEPTQVAGLLNPAFSSWMALKARTNDLPPDFSVLILGATSVSGRLAILLARQLGAKRIVGAARDKAALDKLGLDEVIVVSEHVDRTDFSSLGEIDVVLDYFYGPLTLHLFDSLSSARPVQYVHIGSVSGVLDINLPGALLRSRNITLRGSGPGAWSMAQLAKEIPSLLEIMKTLPEQPVRVVNLKDVETEWGNASGARLVFVP